MKTFNWNSIGISPANLEIIKKNIVDIKKKLAEPGLSDDEIAMYEDLLESYGSEEQVKIAKYMASLKRIHATIKQTFDQSFVSDIPRVSQKFDSYPGVFSVFSTI